MLTGGRTLYDKQALIALIHRLALRRGNFRLASGKTADFYLDCRKVTLDGEGANLVGRGVLDAIRDDLPDCVGGMAIGADPITAATITLAHQRGIVLRGFIVRKEPKGHGTGQQVEGPVEPGQRAVIVEDVATTGGSILSAVNKAREFGLVVDRAIAIVDRGEGASERLAAESITLLSLVNLNELGITV
jgi:orotate phosphoribosyltransferase